MNAISQIRAKLGVTQEALATGIGVTQGNVSNYEQGQTFPPSRADRLIDYARSLGHEISYNDIYGAPPTERKRRKTDHAQPS